MKIWSHLLSKPNMALGKTRWESTNCGVTSLWRHLSFSLNHAICAGIPFISSVWRCHHPHWCLWGSINKHILKTAECEVGWVLKSLFQRLRFMNSLLVCLFSKMWFFRACSGMSMLRFPLMCTVDLKTIKTQNAQSNGKQWLPWTGMKKSTTLKCNYIIIQ